MTLGLMVERYIDPDATPVLVDLGYWDKKSAERFEMLVAAGIGRRNFSIEGFNRLLVKIPKTKVSTILLEFPIVEGGEYWQTTHRWEEPTP